MKWIYGIIGLLVLIAGCTYFENPSSPTPSLLPIITPSPSVFPSFPPTGAGGGDTSFPTFRNYKEINITDSITLNQTYVSMILNFTTGENVTSCSNKTLLTTVVNGVEKEVKSNVSNEFYASSVCQGMELRFLANITANQNTTFYINFNTTNSTNFRAYNYSLYADNFTYTMTKFYTIWTERNKTTEGYVDTGTFNRQVTTALFVSVSNPSGSSSRTNFQLNQSNSTNYTISASIKFVTIASHDSTDIRPHIFFRSNGTYGQIAPLNGYTFDLRNFYDNTQNNFTLSKWVDGTETILNQTNMSSYAAGDVFNITIKVFGSRIQVWNKTSDTANLGELLFDTTDTSFARGWIGVGVKNSNGASGTTSAFNFSNFRYSTDDENIQTTLSINYSIGATGVNPEAPAPPAPSANVTLVLPANNTFSDDIYNINFTYFTNITSIKNCTLMTDNSGTFEFTRMNDSAVLSHNISGINFTFSTAKKVVWGVSCYNTSHFEFAPNENRTLKIANATFGLALSPGISTFSITCDQRAGADANLIKQPTGQTTSKGIFNVTANSTYNLSIKMRLNPINPIGNFLFYGSSTSQPILMPINTSGNGTVLASLNNSNSSMIWIYVNCTDEGAQRRPKFVFIPVSQ